MRGFCDRTQAGRRLAGKLSAYTKRPDVVVLALPRDGVPVAIEVARALNAPLDVFVVRKPDAIGTGGVRVLNDDVVKGLFALRRTRLTWSRRRSGRSSCGASACIVAAKPRPLFADLL
jgi:predicted phosphoribosyltransferase